jgi:hypothetical protein
MDVDRTGIWNLIDALKRVVGKQDSFVLSDGEDLEAVPARPISTG